MRTPFALTALLVVLPTLGCSSNADDGGESSDSDLTGATATVLTQHNDNARTGHNTNESALTLASVNRNGFGKKMVLQVDGEVYAQVLYTNKGNGLTQNVAYVATQNNSVYAFDADTGTQIWTRRFGRAVMSTQLPSASQACGDITDRVGITSTPVIDLANKAMFVVSKSNDGNGTKQFIIKLDITSGQILAQKEIVAQDGGVTFDPQIELQRAGLLLSKGKVYVAFAGHCDKAAYHGWMMSYDAATLEQGAVWNATPTGQEGGIWQAGAGPVADAAGNIYVMTGNGTFDRSVNATDDVTMTSTVMPKNYGSSYVKLSQELQVLDFFTPSNVDLLNPYDIDVGSSGPVLLPRSNMIVGGTKEGVMYLLNTEKMGRFNPPDITTEGAVGRFNDYYHNKLNSNFGALYDQRDATNKYDVYRGIMGTGLAAAPNVHGSPAIYQKGGTTFIYVWTEVAHLKAYRFDGNRVDPNPIVNNNDDFFQLPIAPGMPGGFLSVSSNDGNDGILWALHPLKDDANAPGARVQGILRAYSAADITRELWNSQMNFQRDQVDTFAKFAAPTIANGKVFVPTFSNEVIVYGLLGR
jgi:hypothetical protein